MRRPQAALIHSGQSGLTVRAAVARIDDMNRRCMRYESPELAAIAYPDDKRCRDRQVYNDPSNKYENVAGWHVGSHTSVLSRRQDRLDLVVWPAIFVIMTI